ncbi:MAG: Hydroxyethylthiazole kinase [Pelotomaculum sp. PtaB.Bin104]|nr:MAG: Hydroxyethylthiazole kinase [Pelotomaculum sp. PtaB.Bin104]
MLEKLWGIKEEVSSKRPLVYNITNNVVTNFTANVLLAAGVSPIMSEGSPEAEELAKVSSALLLNIGTLHPRQADYFLCAGEFANKFDKPVVLDPVGAGATSYRSDIAAVILQKVKVSLIRGNYGEINSLMGVSGMTQGVDSLAAGVDLAAMQALAKATGAVIVATGETDYLRSDVKIYQNKTGHSLLKTVVGTGCALSSLMGAFAAVSADRALGALACLAFYGAAAEKAAGMSRGPGSFAQAFLDALYNLSFDEFKKIAAGKVGPLEDRA